MTAGVLDEPERAAIVDRIATDPRAGDLIRETGGLRKVRVPLKGRGKRGGGRLITYFHDDNMPVFLIAFYAKNVQTDLNAEQRKAAKALTDAKIVPGTFGMVLVAAALPKGRSPSALALLTSILDEAKQAGVVQKAIDAKGLKGPRVLSDHAALRGF